MDNNQFSILSLVFLGSGLFSLNYVFLLLFFSEAFWNLHGLLVTNSLLLVSRLWALGVYFGLACVQFNLASCVDSPTRTSAAKAFCISNAAFTYALWVDFLPLTSDATAYPYAKMVVMAEMILFGVYTLAFGYFGWVKPEKLERIDKPINSSVAVEKKSQ